MTVARQWHVYRLYGEGGALLYVGMTGDIWKRLGTHRRSSTSPWFKNVRAMRFDVFATKEEAQRAEADAVATEDPLHNAYLRDGEPMGTLPIRVPTSLYADVCRIAAGRKTTFAKEVRRLVHEYVEAD